jgi:coniferyl-aldehyde dehydrogenase
MTATATEVASAKEPDELRALLTKLQKAHQKMPFPSYEQRVATLDKLEKALLSHKDDFVRAVSSDFGNRSKYESLTAEIYVTVANIRHTRDHLRDWMEVQPREVAWPFMPGRAEVQLQPLGVVGIISPWNYPVQLAIGPMVGALAAGNRVMVKPSELTPKTSALLAEVLGKTFTAEEVVVVVGDAQVGEAFAALPFDHLVFTGSTRVGKLVMRAAAEHLTPVTLELGGKSPTIVGNDFSLEDAAKRILGGKCFNAGQTCIAPDYVLLPKEKISAFVDACKAVFPKLYPDFAKNDDYTTVVNDRHYARLQGYLEEAREKGGKLVELAGAGDKATRKMGPVLVLEPDDGMRLMEDEIFGPILPLVPYEKLEGAIEYVNAHPRPLALYYFGHDQADIDQVLEKTISGSVCVNDTMLQFAQDDLPFGGVGPSGMGHYHSQEGFATFSKKKPVFYQSRINARGVLLPPYGKAADFFFRFTIGK